MWLSDHIFLTEVKMAAFTLPNESFKKGILKAPKMLSEICNLKKKQTHYFGYLIIF